MKVRIDWKAFLILSSIITMCITAITNATDVGYCITTFNYQVWICDANIGTILWFTSAIIMIIYLIWTFFDIIFGE